MIYTLEDARDRLKPYVNSGTCNTTALDARINECIERLLEKADWKHTKRTIRIYTNNHTFALPREVDKILAYTVCGTPGTVFGMTYEFLESGPGDMMYQDSSLLRNLVDMGSNWSTIYDIPSILSIDDTDSEVSDIEVGTGYNIMAFSDNVADRNATFYIRGVDRLNNEVIVGGTPGEDVKLNIWKAATEGRVDGSLSVQNMSTGLYRNLSFVSKSATSGFISLYAVKPDTNEMFFLAKYHPDDTKPNYRRYKITGLKDSTDHANILALVKLRYVPASHAADVLLIQNLSALKLMSMAIDNENQQKIAEAEVLEAKAVRLLAEQLGQDNVTVTPVVIDMMADSVVGNSASIYPQL